jgi:hypothetical protein
VVLDVLIFEKQGGKAILLPQGKGLRFLRQGCPFSLVCAISSLLSSFSLPILSGAFHRNSLFWPKFCPYNYMGSLQKKHRNKKKDPALCGVFAIIGINSYCCTTFSAAGPLAPSTTSKVTRAPSSRDLKPWA